MAGVLSKRYMSGFVILIILSCHCVLSSAFSQLESHEIGSPSIIDNHKLKVETVEMGGLNFPTSMAFLGPNDILVLEKNEGTVKRVLNGTVLQEPLLKVSVANKREMGMLGIAILKNVTGGGSELKKQSAYVYVYYTAGEGDTILGNRLYRYEFLNEKLSNPKLLLEVPSAEVHNGGKLILGPDKSLYLVVGEAGFNDPINSKNDTRFDKTAGILRLDPNGLPDKHSPFGKNYPNNLYYAYGIRNSFGLAIDPITGRLWDTENGPEYGDEINLVEDGFNSGWMIVQGNRYVNESESSADLRTVKDLVNLNTKGKYSSPEFVWSQSIGVTDLAFLSGNKLGKQYEGDMFVGDFNNGYLYHFDLNKDRTGLSYKKPINSKQVNGSPFLQKITFAKGFGGITDIEEGPDGYLYILGTNFGGSDCIQPNIQCIPYNGTNTGSIFRIMPSR